MRKNVAWDPTFSIYEAARDRDKAENQPFFADFLHPSLRDFFRPNLQNHGSFFVEWTTEDEIHWKENYRIWMKAVRDFAAKGGIVGTGEDAGFIYRIYGFGYIRELELQQEAGFPALKVLQHATQNGARIWDAKANSAASARLEGRSARHRREPACQLQDALSAQQPSAVDHQGRHSLPRSAVALRDPGDGETSEMTRFQMEARTRIVRGPAGWPNWVRCFHRLAPERCC